MPVLASLTFDCTLTGYPLASMEIDGRLEEPGGGYDPEIFLIFDASIDTSLTEAARPRASRRQIISFRVYVDGAQIGAGRLFPSLSVDMQLGRPTAWTLSYPVKEGWTYDSPMGGGLEDFYGPPPGKLPIDIDGVYLTANGPRSVRMLTNGVTATADESEGVGGDIDSLQGLDAFGRCDQKLVTLVLPPGHGLSRGAVARRVLAQLGFATSSLAEGGRGYKEIQWVDEVGLSKLQEYFGIESRAVQLNSLGVPENPRTVLDSGVRVDWTFQYGDLLARSGIRRSGSNDGPTRITLTGSKQITRDACGRRSVVQEIIQIGPKLPLTAKKKQASDGSLSTYTPVETPTLVEDEIITRTVITTEYDCETEISTRVEEYAWMNPRTWRYKLQSATTVYGYQAGGYNPNAYLMEAAAVTDDSTEAFLWPQERRVKVSDTLTSYQFDSGGYKVGSITQKHGWVLPELGLKESSSPGAAAWDTLTWKAIRILANGNGAGDLGGIPNTGTEFYTALFAIDGVPGGPAQEQTIEVFTNTEDGYRQGQSQTISRILAEEGGRDSSGKVHLYNGGAEKDRDRETLRVAEIRAERYFPETETTHGALTTRKRAGGARIEPYKIERGLSEYLPAAERRNDIEPPASIYETSGEAAFARAASRHESQPIKASVNSPALEAFREEWELKRGETWAESVAELEAKGIDDLRDLSGLTVAFELPGNLLIRPGHVCDLPRRRSRMIALVKRVNVSQSRDEVVTRCEGRVYVI